jgi:UPF0755 protein
LIRITLLLLLFLLVVAGAVIGFILYGYLFKPNVITGNRSFTYLYIPTGSGFREVSDILIRNKFLKNRSAFFWVARRKHYENKVRPGRFRIRDGMSNNELVNLLRSGKQEPVKVIFQNIRSREDLAGKISRQIEADSLSLLKLLRDEHYLKQFGVNPLSSFVLFIPNTYEFYWNTTAEGFINRMAREKTKFWNTIRNEKCLSSGFSITEAVTLASIIEKETNKDPEKPIIAGVYINRLRKGWPLQADPTIIYAWNDYTIKRVLISHLKINSPYNTYIHNGIPPGPICIPSVSSIDAVLNFQHHGYFYFCAKDDLSGYHVFATTLAEHNRNAKKYQAAIKKQDIR